MKKNYFLLFTLLSLLTANAQLQSGDIAFTGYNSDAPDSFSFVTFVDIPANTSIEFTDNGWQLTGDFRTNEGTATWTSPASTVLAGTEILVISISGTTNIGTFINSGMNFSASGDQVLAYDPTNVPGGGDDSGFYAAIQMNGDWDSDAVSSNTSAQPASLIGFSIALDPEIDNAIYNCSTTSGDVTTLRSAINNVANWTTSNSSLILPECNFMQTLSVDQTETLEFSIYPNPTNTGFVNITTTSSEAVNLSVFDVLGKKVLSQTLNNNSLNVSSLKTGVYILQLNQNGATTTKKLVIK